MSFLSAGTARCAGLALVLAITVAACVGDGQGGDGEGGAAESQLTLAVGAHPSTADSFFDNSLIARAVYVPIYDSLFRPIEGEMVPRLAEEWTWLNDTTLEIQLREGVTFHDGEEFDAEALKWNIDTLIELGAEAVNADAVATIDRVEVVDSHTVNLHLSTPDGGLIGLLSAVFIQSPSAYESDPQEYARAPVGTGPFRVVEWRQDETITMEAFEDHWEGVPQVDRLVIRSITEPGSRVAAIQAGEVDISYDIQAEQAERLQDEAGIEIVNAGLGQVLVLYLRNNQGDPVEDPRVRRAIAHALDVEALGNGLLGDYAQPASGALNTSDVLGHVADLEPYPYDPDQAKQLLTEAGYADGLEVEFATTSGRYAKDREAAEAVAAQLEQVGISVDLRVMESGAWLEDLFASKMPSLYTMGLTSAPRYDAASNYDVICGQIRAADDDQLCDLDDRQRATSDQDERRRILQKMARRVYDRTYAINLYQLPGIYAVSSAVEGLKILTDQSFLDYLNLRVGAE
ncbi:MAG: ABC transporter substrate-binding protein [Actinomycetota bacterium]|nr:ABC transporter substrate-binding protein [Actinomycetota bacterium]